MLKFHVLVFCSLTFFCGKTGLISTYFFTKHPWMESVQACSNKGSFPSGSQGRNWKTCFENLENHIYNIIIFFFKYLQYCMIIWNVASSTTFFKVKYFCFWIFGGFLGFLFFLQSSLVFSNSMETPQTTKIRDIVVENIEKNK